MAWGIFTAGQGVDNPISVRVGHLSHGLAFPVTVISTQGITYIWQREGYGRK